MKIYREVTELIISEIKKGTAPWIVPWKTLGGPLPKNIEGRPYRGINILLLLRRLVQSRFLHNVWLTYRQAKELGGYVRQGEAGTRVIYWNFKEVEERDGETGEPIIDEETGHPKVKLVPFARVYYVFNLSQCAGKKLMERAFKLEKAQESTPDFPEIEKMLSLAKIEVGAKACYREFTDTITLPPREAFRSLEDYYATALHELVHWTAPRVERNLSGRFGDQAYAMEELIAEIGAAFLGAHLGLPINKLQHPQYIASWLEVLEKDTRAIFTAARLAQEACDWLLRAVEEEKMEKAA